jgi:2-desacetyl-2-hydroxyethyl bacteriochlorophyllide A dehydrogenase
VNLSVLGVHADGGMCEYLTLPARLLHKSNVLTPDELALVEPLSIGAHAVRRAQLQSHEHVLVLGAGPIGLATALFAAAAGAQVMVFDLSSRRLDFCCQHVPGVACLDLAQDALEQVSAATSGDLATAVFDCTGNTASMKGAFQFPAHGGRLIFVGIVQDDITLHDPHFHRRELTLLASRNATRSDFNEVLRLLESRRIDAQAWITHRCRFDDFIDAFPGWTLPESGVIKALIEV